MKKLLLLIISFFSLSFNSYSQDFLTKNDGETMSVVIKEITPTTILFVKPSENTGKVYTLSVSEVYSVHFATGVKQVFKQGGNNSGSITATDHSAVTTGDRNRIKIKTTVINVTGNTFSSGKTTGSELGNTGSNSSDNTKSNYQRERSSDGRCNSYHFGFATFINEADFPVEILINSLMVLSPQDDKFRSQSQKIKVPAKEERPIAEIKPGSYTYRITKAYTGTGYPTMAMPILDQGQIYITECEELEIKIR